MANRLAKESSPYLQQHKDNPVDWYPYGQEAMDLAHKLDRPLFISIGYSTCHWCHVMARESFSDPETAKFMNENFVNIKIDREELPAVDKAYQEMYQLLNRQGGGWPLSVYASYDGSPFFLGTYFPNKTSFGMRSFMDINKQIVEAWKNDRDLIDQQATNLIRGLKSLGEYMSSESGEISQQNYDIEIEGLQKSFDGKNGGLGGAPKFPRPPVLEFILQEGVWRQNQDLIGFIRFTYHKMAKGGIYDQIGGGFSRYSVDAEWLVPHFEKMLYDNAGLIELGSKLHAITGDPYIKWVVQDTISWLDREMKSEMGMFYSAQNAESEHREGAYYVWQKNELEKILGENYKIAELRYGITKRGNFDDPHHPEIQGMNVLSIVKAMNQIAEELKLDEEFVFNQLNVIRQKLFEVRWGREHPSTDTKIIVEWNALMIKALFIAAELLEFDEAGALAKLALDAILQYQLTSDRLNRIYQPDNSEFNKREIPGILSDYSFTISACIAAFEYTDDWGYIKSAQQLMNLTDKLFYDQERKVYYLNTSSDTNLLGKVLEPSDDASRSGIGVMIENLFKLGKYIEDEKMVERGFDIVKSFAGRLNEYPGAMTTVLMNGKYFLRYPTEIVIVGEDYNLMNTHMRKYIPHRLIYRWNEKTKTDGRPFWKTLEARDEVDKPTVFICEGMTCSMPLHSESEVLEELNRVQPS